ncbi:2OG-Fe(II) oxygenase [Rhizorhabdus dicambivorans]|uniref:Prolyl 4-hydroxylase alpha subunit Fe(2+) 2OG dioxygenase domain-containing protein n=1 Tax=Rhizorhabdus dicambivorans TaxID=1850238 RepID=A0A2A4FW18_9SPHN|nr:2OG-Fe(II) oxygenase [Rhizorhabdus dicambivorans]ATE65577.1 hypothetical protein CMV14_15170 [Rhizorhabdus dicambivorans]PCE41920.1 hypothetical protein COO09_12925 [Rhizorhabdus dicambivorans]
MSLLALHDRGGLPAFDTGQCRAAGASLAGRYAAADPFPHAVIDELIDPALLASLLPGFPDRTGKRFFDRDQERFKYQFAPDDIADAGLRHLLAELNGGAFLSFLEALTGIEGLIPDPWYLGGGLHETCAGGHLSVHADFNLHPRMKVERRLNLLIYLNADWPAAWGGDLELWDRDMIAARVKVAPLLGRAVIFNTDADSYHGHPEPLACPPDRSRRSIATYYYTALPEGADAALPRTTRFRPRPGSADRPDREVAFDHFVQDWVPRRLQHFARRLNPFRA